MTNNTIQRYETRFAKDIGENVIRESDHLKAIEARETKIRELEELVKLQRDFIEYMKSRESGKPESHTSFENMLKGMEDVPQDIAEVIRKEFDDLLTQTGSETQ